MNAVRRSAGFLVFLSLLTPALLRADSLNGKVLDAANGQGVAGLTVVLQPPSGQGGAEVVTSTDSQGGFSFSGLAGGRHVLSVSQGVTLLYREVVQVSGGAVKEIRLQRG
jgi:hypothetical protein